MTGRKDGRAVRFGLRPKLILFGLFLAAAPLVAIWPVGKIEEVLRREIAWEVDRCAEDILDDGRERLAELVVPGTSGPEGVRGGDADADADDGANDAEGWIRRVAENHHVMVRVLDDGGRITLRTSPRHAERWADVRDLWQGLDDIFYGPAGPPDLLAFEARQRSVEHRPEVLEALAGRRSSRWRYDEQSRMFVYSVAEPLPDGGALYVTRISRRVIRSLYEMRYQLLKLTLFMAAAAILFGLYIGRRMVAPLVSMERAVESYLKHPSKDAAEKIALVRNDEIGDLSRSFGALTSRLHKQVEGTASVAGDLAHDLKNPIATVSASAELLESGEPVDRDRQERLAAALTSAATHMSRSVDGLLGLARLDEELTSSELEPVDLLELVRRVVDEVRATPQCEVIEVILDLPDASSEQAQVEGAKEQLEQLLGNLIDNALAFCEAKVHVGVELESGACTIVVCDDGPGVSEGNREKIFRRFFSARPADAPRGTGLGLSIVAAIARAHGGTVSLREKDNDCPLVGACFEVSLPLS